MPQIWLSMPYQTTFWEEISMVQWVGDNQSPVFCSIFYCLSLPSWGYYDLFLWDSILEVKDISFYKASCLECFMKRSVVGQWWKTTCRKAHEGIHVGYSLVFIKREIYLVLTEAMKMKCLKNVTRCLRLKLPYVHSFAQDWCNASSSSPGSETWVPLQAVE